MAAPSKATSYAPETFDLARPKAEKPSEEEDVAQLEREFEQEFLVNRRTRVRGAKERAIAPGPRLDRHPDDEEAGKTLGSDMAEMAPSRVWAIRYRFFGGKHVWKSIGIVSQVCAHSL